jgi:excisionase family DNA binding protein
VVTPEYLNLPELCDWLKVKPATVYEWTHTHFIPHLKLGRLLRFDRAAIVAWLADRERAGRPTKIVPLKKFSS